MEIILQMDVIIKRNGDNDWKYLYNQYDHSSGYCSLLVSDTRKEDLFFWRKIAPENPRQDTTVHIMYEFYEDWDNNQGSVLLYTNCKTSTDENNYGRMDNLIAGFAMNIYYQIGGGRVRLTDLEQLFQPRIPMRSIFQILTQL